MTRPNPFDERPMHERESFQYGRDRVRFVVEERMPTSLSFATCLSPAGLAKRSEPSFTTLSNAFRLAARRPSFSRFASGLFFTPAYCRVHR